jgi:hypothetical protein
MREQIVISNSQILPLKWMKAFPLSGKAVDSGPFTDELNEKSIDISAPAVKSL